MKKFLGSVFVFVAFLSSCSGNDDRVAELEAQLAELTAQQATTTTMNLAPVESEEPETVAVPNVTGFDKNQAATILQGAGLLAEIEEIPSSDFPAGQVMLQIPRAGTEAMPGDTITIRIASAVTHELYFQYLVRDGYYKNLGNNECEYRKGGGHEGASFRILGPNNDAISAGLFGKGKLEDDEESSTGKSCFYEFTLKDIPEVATYTFVTDEDRWPTLSLADVERFEWSVMWWSDRP